jgi:vacuolar protein sorting-associated protein VTA1
LIRSQEKKKQSENEAITNEVAAQAHVENYAMKLFGKADSDDRTGRATKSV